MALTIVTWLWGSKYGHEDVKKLSAGVARHLAQPYRFIVAHPELQDEPLTKIPGCFCRLRMFSVEWQDRHGIKEGDRLVCMDLDTVITGPLDPLFDRDEDFVILQGGNAANPCPYVGALMMLRAGVHSDVWTNFSLAAASKIKFYSFPDDQGWLWHKIPNAAGWKAGRESGAYVYMKPGWPMLSDALPSGARLVTFTGWRSPEKFKHLNWVKENWL